MSKNTTLFFFKYDTHFIQQFNKQKVSFRRSHYSITVTVDTSLFKKSPGQQNDAQKRKAIQTEHSSKVFCCTFQGRMFQCSNCTAIYIEINVTVPLQDLKVDFKLSRVSMDALIMMLPHGWGHSVTILITMSWYFLSWGLSGSSSLCAQLVHKNHKDSSKLPTVQELNNVGRGQCVGAIDESHVRIKTNTGPTGQDYINGKLCLSDAGSM